MEIFTDQIFLYHRVGPGVRQVNACRADVVEGRNECIESLPEASQADFPGQVKGGRDAFDLKGGSASCPELKVYWHSF